MISQFHENGLGTSLWTKSSLPGHFLPGSPAGRAKLLLGRIILMRIPTDLEILSAAYKQAVVKFSIFDRDNPDRSSKTYVPIDVVEIASLLEVDPDMVFGRLYFDLEKRHGYVRDKGVVNFFALKVGGDRNCVNFPLLSSVLADLQEQKRKSSLSIRISLAAIGISLLGTGLTAGFRVYELMQPAANPPQIQPPTVQPSPPKK